MNRVETPTAQLPTQPAVPNGPAPVAEKTQPSPQEVPFEQQIPKEKRSLARKIFAGLKQGVKNWAKNLDPRGKSFEWKVGVGIGVVETLGFMALPIPAVKGYVKAGINFAAAQGVYFAARKIQSKEEKRVEQEFKGDKTRLQEEKQKLLEKHGKAQARMRNFFLGVSAGATYASATSLGLEAAKSVTSSFTHVDVNAFTPKVPTAEAAGYHDPGVSAEPPAIEAERVVDPHLSSPTVDVNHPADPAAEPTFEVERATDSGLSAPKVDAIKTVASGESGLEIERVTDPTISSPSVEAFHTAGTGPEFEIERVTDPNITAPKVDVDMGTRPADSGPTFEIERVTDANITEPKVEFISTTPSHPPVPETAGVQSPDTNPLYEKAATKFQEDIAAAVGHELYFPPSNTLADELIKSYGIDPKSLPPDVYDQAHKTVGHAIQRRMEEKATNIFVQHAGGWNQDLTKMDGWDLDDPTYTADKAYQHMIAQARDEFFKDLQNPDVQKEIIQNAKAYLTPRFTNFADPTTEAARVFQDNIAASVGEQLPLVNQLTNKMVENYGVNTMLLPEPIRKMITDAMRHGVEKKATEFHVADIGGWNLDLSKMSDPDYLSKLSQGHKDLAEWLRIPSNQAELIGQAQAELLPQLSKVDQALTQVASSIPANMQRVLTGPQAMQLFDDYVKKAQPPGMNYPMAEYVVTHLAANYDHVKNALGPILARTNINPGFYALLIEDLENELQKAQNSGMALHELSEKLRPLLTMLHSEWNYSPEQFRELTNPEGIQKALELLRKAKQTI